MPQVSLTRWRPHLIAAETQGLSIAAYAKQHSILSPHVTLRSNHYPDVAWLASLVRTLASTS